MDIFDLINKKPFPLKAVDVLVSGFPCQAFSLAGYRIIGSFFTSHSCHELNIKLLKEIFSSKENWELISSN